MTDDRFDGALREGAGHVQDAFGGLTGDTKSQVKGKLNEAAGSAQKAYGKVAGQAEDAYAQAMDQAGDLLGDVEGMIRERPLATAGAALGVGVLLGLMLRGGRKTVYAQR